MGISVGPAASNNRLKLAASGRIWWAAHARRSLAGALGALELMMRERIRQLRQKLLARVDQIQGTLKRDTSPRQAAYAFLRRARSIDRAIWVLLEAQSVAEAAILLRTQMNLLWCFLFLVDARAVADGFQFESEPGKDSPFYRRSSKYLSWQWIDLYRMNATPLATEKFNAVIRDLGYASEADIRAYWYQEGTIRNFKGLAESVGAAAQYEEDYSHLSGIEHSDMTAVIVENMDGERYGDYVAFKSSQVLESVMDFSIPICGCAVDDHWKHLVTEFNTVADEVVNQQRTRDGA